MYNVVNRGKKSLALGLGQRGPRHPARADRAQRHRHGELHPARDEELGPGLRHPQPRAARPDHGVQHRLRAGAGTVCGLPGAGNNARRPRTAWRTSPATAATCRPRPVLRTSTSSRRRPVCPESRWRCAGSTGQRPVDRVACTRSAASRSEYILDWLSNGRRGERIGNRHPWLAPQGCYPCAGDDLWCVLTVRSDAEWQSVCRVMGQQALADDPRFATNADACRTTMRSMR